jgi:hypothetical protein
MQQLGLFIDIYQEMPNQIPVIETRNKYVVQEGLKGGVYGEVWHVTQVFEQALEFIHEGKEITEDELIDFVKAYTEVVLNIISIIGTHQDNLDLVVAMGQMDAAYEDFMAELERVSLANYWAAALLAKHEYLPPVIRRNT